MPQRKGEMTGGFASVYDALYEDAAFLAARAGYISSLLDPRDGPVLDAGCGTGAQAALLIERGYRVIGLDLDRAMLAVARERPTRGPLVCADLRHLPFRAAFDGILCLESPLAYLLDDGDFMLALAGLRRALLPRGRLIIDTYDYPATLDAGRARLREAVFGCVRVAESHRYNTAARVWTMRQRFVVAEGDGERRFEVKHRLKLRSPDEYAAGLESAGLAVLEMLPGYPGQPERRIVVVAQAT